MAEGVVSLADEDQRERALWECDWATTLHGDKLHHATKATLTDYQDYTSGDGETSCGRKLFLLIPGMFTRMGAERCGRCCDVLGYPRGTGSPKNDEKCKPFLSARLKGLGLKSG